ncbi:branched-chain amino acid ABC transporter permease [Pueribacillus theae]|uniref:Branched-chain amino acid ABC transporter permease n=1 Tax=Pueribacillus theae TaxID=2171751 RepID=A0A2U1K5H9_9BACI|nr:branched-chain amino acid ABC transporter permease [Pueribacillus theae]PWA12770.1 branched-chain amino acid ABC transporter permease [Pueribacillus theae]
MNKIMDKRIGIAVLVILSIIFPLLFDNKYIIHVMSLAFIYIIAIYGMNLLAGFTGYLSLAHAGFFAIGAYSLGVFTTKYEMTFWVSFVAAIVFTTVVGAIIGLIALRTKEHFFAIYTLIVGYLIYLLIDKWDVMTGGVRGLIGIPVPTAIGPIEFKSGLSMYYLILFFLLLSTLLITRIVHSLTGRTFIAIRNSEELAQTIGINTMTNKLVSFIISIFFAALAGALYASFVRFLGPDIANLPMVFDFLMYLIVGGLGTLSGPIVGTLLIVWLSQFLQGLQEYRMLLFGPILTLIVIFYPAGIVGAYRTIKMKLKHKKDLDNNNPVDKKVSNTNHEQSQIKEG